jgi:hypothetical protein
MGRWPGGVFLFGFVTSHFGGSLRGSADADRALPRKAMDKQVSIVDGIRLVRCVFSIRIFARPSEFTARWDF